LFLQIAFCLFASRFFLCKAEQVCLQNAGFVSLIMPHNLLHITPSDPCRKPRQKPHKKKTDMTGTFLKAAQMLALKCL